MNHTRRSCREGASFSTGSSLTQKCYIPDNYRMTPLLQAAEALVAALIDDPFYWAISEDFGTDLAARKVALKSYFCYSVNMNTCMPCSVLSERKTTIKS